MYIMYSLGFGKSRKVCFCVKLCLLYRNIKMLSKILSSNIFIGVEFKLFFVLGFREIFFALLFLLQS